MNLNYLYLLIASVFLCSCSDSSESQNASAVAETGTATSSPGTTAQQAGQFDRKTFILCPALEDHRDELAGIVGFEQNPERSLAMSARSSKCAIRGKGGDFLAVDMVPAMIKSIEQHATQSFEGSASPVPELGDDAMYVQHTSQPRVIFRMDSILIDVHVENYEKTPDRTTMVSLATRVKEILTNFN